MNRWSVVIIIGLLLAFGFMSKFPFIKYDIVRGHFHVKANKLGCFSKRMNVHLYLRDMNLAILST